MREPRDERGRRRVRPYAVTRGRTRPSDEDLELEALVSTTVLGEAARGLSPEHHSIALLCRDILSIAEISAHLSLPVGVARVLVGDMADEGLLQVHRPTQVGDRPDIVLLERVLHRLRTI